MLPILILNAGEGTRLYPLTKNIPKCLIEFNKKPFIYYQIKLLESQGFTDIILSLGYRQEQIEEYIKKEFLKSNIKIIYNNFLPNTGGGTKRASALVKNNFFVIYGDSFLPHLNYNNIEKDFYNSKKYGLLTIYKNENKFDNSNILYSESNKKITDYKKESKNKEFKYIDYGVSVFSQDAFEYVKNLDYFELGFLHKKLIQDDQLHPYIVKERFYEIGSLNGIKDFTNYLKEN
jgi:NDP-sugar pyrophosphorylase family protein